MIAGNAAGEVLPPYVVYKSKHLWDTWTNNGPPGTRYANTASGWFESETFSDWFFQLLLPTLTKIEGKKVIIGDNLSSHLNVDVLAACKDHDIQFVCLPPNSTHVTQPLDVAFFAPLKKAWREILSDYKESLVGSRSNVLEKQHFPTLLRRLMEKISENSASNLISGFRKCGIVPCDVGPLLERLHNKHNSVVNRENVSEIEKLFLESLENKRTEATQFQVRGRKKKITIPAGKSIAHGEIGSADLPGTSGIVTAPISKHSQKQRANEVSEDEESDKLPELGDSDDEVDEIQDMEEEIEFNKKLESGYFAKSAAEKIQESGLKDIQKSVGEYALVLYDGKPYPGVITEIEGEMVKINAMVKSLKFWKWPKKGGEIWYSWDKILGAINAPKQMTKRGLYSVLECDRYWWN
ncbi:unnamed protein product [Acanthoscelides obtectus]|uniref:DDE-1 domain-containing protein n=1 Tax=Acanthoscelides obtectus TaxID=200917 RepID=A0A9P0P5U2_ACAOB|nr:unnamed protein product [Acanthoscelides obtectus]CAK1622695.1 hypothetical protein AOBTE_LOCUS1629 [Acanthoscelides obtectus]